MMSAIYAKIVQKKCVGVCVCVCIRQREKGELSKKIRL